LIVCSIDIGLPFFGSRNAASCDEVMTRISRRGSHQSNVLGGVASFGRTSPLTAKWPLSSNSLSENSIRRSSS